jgi:drug/metabolite transporter (DMT)-like permease
MDRGRGYLFAFLSTLAMSNVYIFSKSALSEVSLAQFGFYWFGFALILFMLLLIFKKDSQFRNIGKKEFKTLLLVGVLEILSTSMFFLAIKSVENPTIVSFLGNLKPIFVIFLGLIILGEGFSKIESIGILITIAGAFILGYQEDLSFQALLDNGVVFILISLIFGGLSMVLVRKNSVTIPSLVYAISRSVFLMIAAMVFLFFTDDSILISKTALKNIAFGASMGPFLAILSFYNAIKYLEAARVSLIGTSKGIFVMIGSFMVFDRLPSNMQIVGGLITIFGVITIIVSKNLFKEKKV